MLALSLGGAQGVVGALEIARLLSGAGRLLLRVDEAARRLLLLGVEEDLQAPIGELAQGQERLGEGLALRAGGQEVRQAAAVEQAGSEGQGSEARSRPRRRVGRLRLQTEPTLGLASLAVVEQTVEGARAIGAALAVGSGLQLAQGLDPLLEQGVAAGLQEDGRSLERRHEPLHAAFLPASARGLSPTWRWAMPPVRARQDTASKPAARMSSPSALGTGKRSTEAGRYA